MGQIDPRGLCACCRQVVPLTVEGRLTAPVPAGLAARGLDGERCPRVLPRLGAVHRRLPRTA